MHTKPLPFFRILAQSMLIQQDASSDPSSGPAACLYGLRYGNAAQQERAYQLLRTLGYFGPLTTNPLDHTRKSEPQQ